MLDRSLAAKLILFALVAAGSVSARAQTFAVIAPDGSEQAAETAERIASEFPAGTKVLDIELARAAYSAAAPATPFNMPAESAKTLGRSIGCDAYILVRSATQRRSSSQRSEYYESYAAFFLVSTRSGQLIDWQLKTFNAAKPDIAHRDLAASLPAAAAQLTDAARRAIRSELAVVDMPYFLEPPEPGTPEAKVFKAPIPYRRIKPEYTTTAALYDIKATVDLMVYLDEKGTIVRTEFQRWAGYGLDASVEANVRGMNWRPGESAGKPVAVKFLVRYNFTKID